MKRASILCGVVIVLISANTMAQEIQVGMPLLKVLPILSSQNCNVDTFREGRILSYITQLKAEPFVRFGVAGQARFCFDAGSGTLQGWTWTCDSMAPTDYRFIVREISRKLRDTGEENELSQGLSHRWDDSIFIFYNLYFNWQHQLTVWEGNMCRLPPSSDTTTAPPAFATAPPPPPPVDTTSAIDPEGADNFSYKVVEEDANPNYKWGHVSVVLSKKITKAQLTSVAKSIRGDKWESNSLMIFFRIPGMSDSGYAWVTASFDGDKKDVTTDGSDAVFKPHLDLLFIGSSIEGQRRAIDTTKRQKIDGKVIGVWYEEQYTHSIHIIFEKKGKTFVRQIIAGGGGLSQESDDPVVMSDIELKKSEVQGVTRLVEPEDSHGEYFLINKDGNLEIYDEEGYMTTGEKIQP